MEELDDVISGTREKLWAQAMLFACDVTNKSVTTSMDGGKSPHELWFGKFPTAEGACVNIRWRQKEKNAYSWEFPATSPLAR